MTQAIILARLPGWMHCAGSYGCPKAALILRSCSVAVAAGYTVVTRTPCAASSKRSESASSRRAALLPANAAHRGTARMPGDALTKITCPRDLRSAGSNSRVSSAAAATLTVRMSCHVAGSVSATEATAETPAQ
jgi:hypothetical protein